MDGEGSQLPDGGYRPCARRSRRSALLIFSLKRTYARLAGDAHFSEILTGSVFAIVAQVLSALLAMVASVIVARVYGAGAVGVLAVINAFLMLVTIFTVLGTSTAILRLIPEHVARFSFTSAFRVYRKTEYLVAAVSLVTGALFFFAADFVAGSVFSKPRLSFLFAVAAVFVVFRSLMQLNTSAVRGLRLIKTFAFMQVLPSLAFLVALVSVVWLRSDPNAPVYAQLVAYAATALVGTWIMDRAFRHRMKPGDMVERMPLREIAAVSLPMLMTASMQFFIGQTGVVMLGMFRSEAEVGYYSVAVRLALLTAFVLTAINSMAASKFSELYHTDRMDELLGAAKKATKMVFWTTIPILLALVVLGEPILKLLYGGEFTVAYLAMVLLVAGQFVNSISGSTGIFLNMTGHQTAFRNIMFFAAILNVSLNWLLIPRFGINGAAFAAMATFSFWNISTLVFIKRKFGRTIGYVPLLG
jgi:O-antigen/teichoic acid export membrane protein